MFSFFDIFRRKFKRNESTDNNETNSATGVEINESVQQSVKSAQRSFAKSKQYDRSAYEDTSAMNKAKNEAFKNSTTVKDPYTGKRMFKDQASAKENYGENWQEHAAETDHIDPLEAMGIPYTVLSKEEDQASIQIKDAVKSMQETKECYALIIEKDTFENYQLSTVISHSELSLSREEAISTVASAIGEKDVIVSTTGMISRELFEYRTMNNQGHERDFLTVGSMGHASQIALGIAMEKQDRCVWCFDGDGAAIMHLGGLAIVASKKPKNYIHVLFNNGAHDSVGGQPTVGLDIDLPAIAKAVGYNAAISVASKDELEKQLKSFCTIEGPILLEVKVKKGNRKDLGRPTTTPIQNKEALMDFLKK